MGIKCNTYVSKGYGVDLYKWSPGCNFNKKQQLNSQNTSPFYCNAVAGGSGQDWINTYSYDIIIDKYSQQQRIPYVECDYVQ